MHPAPPIYRSAIGEKISAELVGTFFFGLMSFAITATGMNLLRTFHKPSMNPP
jgi:hypothetical protein